LHCNLVKNGERHANGRRAELQNRFVVGIALLFEKPLPFLSDFKIFAAISCQLVPLCRQSVAGVFNWGNSMTVSTHPAPAIPADTCIFNCNRIHMEELCPPICNQLTESPLQLTPKNITANELILLAENATDITPTRAHCSPNLRRRQPEHRHNRPQFDHIGIAALWVIGRAITLSNGCCGDTWGIDGGHQD
jgi:hypothetical protein